MSSTVILLIVVAAIIALLMAFFQYYYKSKDRSKTNILLLFLRFLSIFSLLVLIINPKIESNKIENIRPVLNVLVDNSASIAYANEQDKVSNFVTNLKENSALNQKFDINYYTFSDRLSVQDTLAFNAHKTTIITPLQELQELYKDRMAPTLLITDGNQTQGVSYAYYKAKNPIYSVVVGDTLQYDDLKISQINVNSYTNLNNNFPVEIFIQYKGKESINKSISVTQNNTVVFKKNLAFSKEKLSQRIQFNLKAHAIGIQNYHVQVASLENEKNTINNSKSFSIEVVDEQAKILILSAVNHPDIGMIRRSISSNKQHKVELQNDLNKKYQYKDYQLVILYQPTSEFAKIFEDIESEQANVFIITGPKTDWRFLNKAQPFFTKKAISKKESYFPVYNPDFNEFITEDIQFSEFTPLTGYFGELVFNVPFKTVLYQRVLSFETKNPLLATFTLDNRRGALLSGSDSWKWRMQSKVTQNTFQQFDQFFNKLIQYLSSTKKYDRLEVEYNPFVYANENVIIKAQYFDANYVFDTNASLTLSLTNKTTKEQSIFPFTLKNNYYEVVYSDLEAGDYSFSVQTKDKSIRKYGSFSVLTYDVEQQLATANVKDLKLLAKASGGISTAIDNTEPLITQLIEDNQYRIIQTSKRHLQALIDWQWLLALTLFLLTLEWFIRKYYGKI